MSPLQKIAMGMVIVIGSALFPAQSIASWAQYDALPDPIGWLLVVLGMVALARADDTFVTSRWLAIVAGAVSVPMWVPQLHHHLDASGEWFASLPQIAFCLVLSREIGLLGARQKPPDGYVAKRFGLLVWGFAVIGVLPVLTLGGGLTGLETPPCWFDPGQRRVRLRPVPGAPARVARRPGTPGGPPRAHPGSVGRHTKLA